MKLLQRHPYAHVVASSMPKPNHKQAWLPICLILLLTLAALPRPAAGAEADLILHFDSDSAEMTQAARERLNAYMEGVDLGRDGKVLVVGHADEKGERKHNLALSRKRAGAVKRLIVDTLGFPAERVLTVGQGNDAPVAGNDTDRGRAKNRRVVVRLVSAAAPEIQRRYGGSDPRLAMVDALLGEADTKIRRADYAAALADLDRAAELGGDQYSRWHTARGILGYLGGQPPHKLRGYFEMALALNSHDTDARDFLGRIAAREAFLEGRIVPYMGRTPRSAIKVTTRSQEYEYLRLFEVEPLSHHTLASGTIDVWTCRSGQGREVVYHFDTTQLLEWAYPGGDSQS